MAVLDPESGELVEERFAADRESLARWAEQCLLAFVAHAGLRNVRPHRGSVSRFRLSKDGRGRKTWRRS